MKTLELLATHMSVAVENDRLYRNGDLQRPESSKTAATVEDLAHALRTPLSSIKGYSNSLLQPDISWAPEVRQEFLETIYRESDKLNQVIDCLLPSMAYAANCRRNGR